MGAYYDDEGFVLTPEQFNYIHNRVIKNKEKKMINKKDMNKFYVGATHIAQAIANGHNGEWTHKTVDEAIAHGKQTLIKENRDCVVIVKIVKIIRKREQPIIVEDVK
jgi:hypothetical protein